MTINPILKIIRAKKLGILIRDAREKSDNDNEEVARAMGITPDELKAMELGERAPTLPELEMLAFYLDVPLEHFWENEVLKQSDNELGFNPDEIGASRQKEIGELISQGRTQASLSIEELAQQSGISPASLQLYEQGEAPIPLPELEVLAKNLNNPITYFEDQQGPIGSKFTEKRNINEFLELPVDLQEFIGKPINRPYLELAVRLSELKVERLRALAEGLLEITL
jgi:transcriptional regulator with XRE-family HTH domain